MLLLPLAQQAALISSAGHHVQCGTVVPPESHGRGMEETRSGGGLGRRIVAFTTPPGEYSARLEGHLRSAGAEALWCPTLETIQTDDTRRRSAADAERFLGPAAASPAHGVAFTSRAGIRGFAPALRDRRLDEGFLVGALGRDAELLDELDLDLGGARRVVPSEATPAALAAALGDGRGRALLCPVPRVEGLSEPPVVPRFLADLRARGWDAVPVRCYVTRWLGPDCARPLLLAAPPPDALVFTSTAEVEGLLKSLERLGRGDALRRGTRRFLVAAHGPVTARGTDALGVPVDIVGKQFHSFAGVVQALEAEFCARDAR